MANEYSNNEDFSIRLCHIAALAFLLSSEIPNAFDQVKSILPQNVAEVVQYFEDNYVYKRRRELRDGSVIHKSLLFLPEIWLVYERVKLRYPRTQNIIKE